MEDIMSDESEKDSDPGYRYGLLRDALKIVAEGLKLLDALASLLLRVL